MIIDSHVHVWSYPALFDLEDKIRTTEDLITFRTKYPDLYERTLHEEPVDNSDQLIAHMDERGIEKALVQARPGAVTNDQIAGCFDSAPRHHSFQWVSRKRLGYFFFE